MLDPNPCFWWRTFWSQKCAQVWRHAKSRWRTRNRRCVWTITRMHVCVQNRWRPFTFGNTWAQSEFDLWDPHGVQQGKCYNSFRCHWWREHRSGGEYWKWSFALKSLMISFSKIIVFSARLWLSCHFLTLALTCSPNKLFYLFIFMRLCQRIYLLR